MTGIPGHPHDGSRVGLARRGLALLLGLLMIAALAWSGPGAVAQNRPKIIPLRDGFQPEGIATRGPNTFFVGSIPTGAVDKGDLRTGQVSRFVRRRPGRSAIGLSVGTGMLFVAGGDTGQAYVYDATTGRPLGVFQLTTGTTFVNDVIATRRAAYFTDSFKPQLYKVPIEGKGDFGTPETLPLTGDLVFEDGFNTNGIDATANGRRLVVVQSNTGELFRVDPETGVTREIDLGGQTVVNGDGILLDGSQRLWVVQNADNLLTLVRVNPLLRSGRIAGRFTDDSFDVPTTVAKAAGHLAVVNARFGTPSPNTAEYWVTQIPRPRP